MNRKDIQRIVEDNILEKAAGLYGTNPDRLLIYPGYEGAANLVYNYQFDGVPMILRISFRSDRSRDQIAAELDFIEYLSRGGLKVSKPGTSRNGNLIETLETDGHFFHISSFFKGKGMRVPDNDYKYREDVPIEEYFHNWGATLGRMHALAKDYHPGNEIESRPDWFGLHKDRLAILEQIPPELGKVQQRIHSLLLKIREIPINRETYGLIHGDFNDGNFTVNYGNGEITVFDFDDCCYFYFVYELATAWEGGIGRVMFRGLEERVAFMDHYWATVMKGYKEENELPKEALEQLPTFILLVQVEEFLHYLRYLEVPDQEIQTGLRYKIKCIQDEIPYMGFFDPIYDPSHPFKLVREI